MLKIIGGCAKSTIVAKIIDLENGKNYMFAKKTKYANLEIEGTFSRPKTWECTKSNNPKDLWEFEYNTLLFSVHALVHTTRRQCITHCQLCINLSSIWNWYNLVLYLLLY